MGAFRVGVGWGVVLFLLSLLYTSNAQDDTSVLTDIDAVFTKPTPTLTPNAEPPPPTLSPTPLPTNSSIANSKLRLTGSDNCVLSRDIYCTNLSKEEIDKLSTMSDEEKEKAITRKMDEAGISYRPFVSGNIDYYSSTDREPGWAGFTVMNKTEHFDVDAFALGVVIKSISDIDPVHGTFLATLKFYVYNITETFSTIQEAFDTIYKDSSMTTRTTVKDSIYYRLREQDIDGAWSSPPTETEDGEFAHPDGVCKASAMKSMRPILAEEFNMDVLRLPHLNSKIVPTMVSDDDGFLSYIDVVGAEFKFKPINRKYFPVQIDLLDIRFEMGSPELIHEDQRIITHLLCLHPSFSGFSNHVFGSDKAAGHTTSDSLTMVPYLYFDRVEPWLTTNLTQFHYGEIRQRLFVGHGSNLQRMLGLRIIVKQPTTKGWFEVLPILFVSLAAVANFVSSDPDRIGGTSMVQALLGVNSLVTQNTELIGPQTRMGQSLLLAYGITGVWIFTVVLMMVINSAKGHASRGSKWYVIYQLKIFRYMRLLDGSLCLLYIPLLSAHSIDEGNGNQEELAWVWVLVVGFIVGLVIIRIVMDYSLIKKKRRDQKEDSLKALVFSSKPLNLWDQDAVLRWIRIGTLHQATYFSVTKRSLIAEKLEAACADGELLSEYGTDIEKLVQFVGLSFGDAVKLSKELKLLVVRNNAEPDATELSSALVMFKEGYP